MADGTEGGHIEGTTNRFTSAGDMARTSLVTAVLIVRSDSRQGGRGGITELAQLRHVGQDGGTGGGTDAGNGFQPFGFAAQSWIASDELADGLVALVDLLVQEPEQLARLFSGKTFGVMFGSVGFPDLEVDELAAAGGQFEQLSLLGAGPGWVLE